MYVSITILIRYIIFIQFKIAWRYAFLLIKKYNNLNYQKAKKSYILLKKYYLLVRIERSFVVLLLRTKCLGRLEDKVEISISYYEYMVQFYMILLLHYSFLLLEFHFQILFAYNLCFKFLRFIGSFN